MLLSLELTESAMESATSRRWRCSCTSAEALLWLHDLTASALADPDNANLLAEAIDHFLFSIRRGA